MAESLDCLEATLAVFAEATQANLRTSGRSGIAVLLTPERAGEVMITGDLHGNRENFDRIKDTADLESHPRRHLILQEVCHGGPTYPQGGGCMSHTVLEDVARLKVAYPQRVHFLLGNHELAELAGFPIEKNRRMLNVMFRMGLEEKYGTEFDRVRQAYFPFLRSCPLVVRLPHGVFIAHSIPEKVDVRRFDMTVFARPLDEIEFWQRSGIFDLVWGRDYRAENAWAFAELVGARVLIGGHEPCRGGFWAPNDIQIVLDCCGANAAYVIIPVNEPLTHDEILGRVCLLT